jgi:hypothetical protein
MKLEEYKQEQQKLLLETKSFSGDYKTEVVAAKDIRALAKQARSLFLSSKLEEKQ